MKTVQELMRHAISKLALDVYPRALTPAKRAAHSKVVESIRPAEEGLVVYGAADRNQPTPEPWQGYWKT